MKSLRRGGINAIKRRYAYLFLAPWICGIIIFVLVPIFKSVSYSFANVTISQEGLRAEYTGLNNYKELFLKDPEYVNRLTGSLSSLFTSLPIVIALSMVLALVLNQNFKGRAFARSIFFLPVIIGSGAVMTILASYNMNGQISASVGMAEGQQAAEYMQIIDFSDLLHKLNLPEGINKLMSGYLENCINLIWNCGVPILLFVAGLQTIPEQLYEVGKVEGISVWEEFWYITVPMMGRIILLVLFYTMVELFIEKSNLIDWAVLRIRQQDYSMSSAMLWPYFLIVGAVIGAVIFLYSKLCLKKWE